MTPSEETILELAEDAAFNLETRQFAGDFKLYAHRTDWFDNEPSTTFRVCVPGVLGRDEQNIAGALAERLEFIAKALTRFATAPKGYVPTPLLQETAA